jgi:hypothetical protein
MIITFFLEKIFFIISNNLFTGASNLLNILNLKKNFVKFSKIVGPKKKGLKSISLLKLY